MTLSEAVDVATKLNNINIKISIRTTAQEPLQNKTNNLIPILVMAFDSTKHNINHICKLSHRVTYW